jgi:hypothetical protein
MKTSSACLSRSFNLLEVYFSSLEGFPVVMEGEHKIRVDDACLEYAAMFANESENEVVA